VSAPYHNKALPEGTVLREWRLEEVLGVGGFGIVYRGTGVYFGESVAIKEYFPGAISDRVDGTTVTPTDSSSEEIYLLGRQKFLEEAKVLWGLSHPERHPNIVSVRSLFEIHGTAYMVMDFENGLSLSQMLKDGKRFDEKSLLAIIRPIAEGLDRAHQAGVLHRDIKPANILVDKEGRPVLIDFGSARFDSSQATNTKVTFYTPPYAALEQYVKSYPQGPWTDIYALGVVLYQCVSGDKPPEVLERLHGEDSSSLSSSLWPGFSSTFTRAVDAAMAVRPLERPASIAAWLKLFEGRDPAPFDDVTRIAIRPSAPPPDTTLIAVRPSAPVPAPKPAPAPKFAAAPAAAAAPANAANAAPKRGSPKHGSRGTLILFGAVAGFALLAVAGLVSQHLYKLPATDTPAPVTQTVNKDAPLGDKLNAVMDAAQKAELKANEMAALSSAKDKLAGLIASKAAPEQLTAAATDLAKAESDTLTRTSRRMWRDLGGTPGPNDAPGGADAIAKLQAAKAALDSTLGVPPLQDAGQVLDQARLSLANFAAFQDATKTATPFYVAARHKAFDTLHTDTQGYLAQVASLASVEKPWFLASTVRKNAYKLRQDNAAQAKALGQRLDDLSKTVAASSDLHALGSAITEAADAKKSAGALYASSSAAAL
jgi:serine/threonine protein kinase